MPPYSYPTFEEIEAKEWASNTVKTILTDVLPVSFESDFSSQKSAKLEIVINDSNKKTSNKRTSINGGVDNPLRRSFSFLEGSLFFTPSEEKEQQKNARRSQSTILPSTSTATTANNKNISQSAPTTPINKLSPQPSFSSRIRDTLHASSKNTSDIFEHKKSSKEQKAITIWKNTFAQYMIHSPTSLEFEPKPYSKRSIQLSKFIMTELLTTEETYLNHLMTIKNFYMDPLLEAATTGHNKKSSLVNLKDVEIIFAFIPQLIILSSALVERLHETISLVEEQEEPNGAYIGKVFCDLEPYFDIYIAYTVNFSKSRKYLSKASSSIVYRQLVQDTMRKRETNRMLLSDYMIAPIQRITRYCLLLKDLQKYSNPSNPDHVYLDKTLKCLSALAFAMNTVQ